MTTGSVPLISVVMAAYNGAGLIEDTIASVLEQDCGDFELIVVDDASTDDTLARLRAITDPRVRVLAAQTNGGPVVARNMAHAVARGRYIVGLDQDDLCHPDRFSTQVAWLEAHPQAVLVASAVALLEKGRIRPARAPFETSPVLIDWRLQFGNPLVWSSVMIRAEAVRQLAVFERVDRLYAEDFDLYQRLSALGPLGRIDRPLVTYRIHPGGASRRYTQTMDHNATGVLAERYADLFDDAAHEAAHLALVHFTGGVAVPDAAKFERLGKVVHAVHDRFCATRQPSLADQALILGEYARLWWRVADASVRAGAVSPGAIRAACPPGLQPRHPSPRRAIGSGLVGSARALLSRWQALAR